MTIPIYPEAKVALKGKKGLIVGIANDQSIAWGCVKASRALGADLAVTYLNDRARKHVEPLAKALEAPIFMPLDVNTEGQLGQVFEKISKGVGPTRLLASFHRLLAEGCPTSCMRNLSPERLAAYRWGTRLGARSAASRWHSREVGGLGRTVTLDRLLGGGDKAAA